MRQAVPSRARIGGEGDTPGAFRFAPVAGAAAAFTGRAHGNVSFLVGGGDPAAARRALGPLAGAAADRAVFMEQVHGARVALVSAADAGRGLRSHGDAVAGADALVTTETGLALAVLTADCVPVLLASEHAVAAVHAGRAGLLAGVVERTLELMAGLGAPPATVTAVIGPAIGACCYEVPADLAEQARGQIGALAGQTAWGTPSLDLPAGVAAVLRGAGAGRVSETGPCTRCAPEAWFSHRAVTDGREPRGQEGRQASVIARVLAGTHAADAASLPEEPAWLS